MTSNCNWPTAPTMKSAPISGRNSWVTPSSARPSSAFFRCLAFSGSLTRTRCRISGAKFGRPANRTTPLSDRLSPTRSTPWFGMPITSPAKASSASSRSEAKNMIGALTDRDLPVFWTFSFMPRLKAPEAMRNMAIRSRWLGSILAWTLKTKPVTSSAPGSTVVSTGAGALRVSGGASFRAFMTLGAGAQSPMAFSSSSMPKWRRAEPHRTGVIWPSRKA